MPAPSSTQQPQCVTLTGRAAAAAIGVSERALFDLRARGAIAFVRIGRRIVYLPSDLALFLQKRRRVARALAATSPGGRQ